MSNHSFEDPELARGPVGALPDTSVSVSWEPCSPAGSHLRATGLRPAGNRATPPRKPAQLQVSLAVSTGPHGGARALVVASGEIDIATVGPLRAATLAVAVAAHPRPDRPVPLVLDWEGIVFLDSSGVHFLQDLHAEGIEQGWALRLMAPSAPAPARLLRLAADHGWLPWQLAHQLPPQLRRELHPEACPSHEAGQGQ